MEMAIALASESMQEGCGPFGAVVVRGEQVIATGKNRVVHWLDPTAHAEMVAVREACKALQSFQLTDCVLYSSCEPCPMCLGAIYWSRPAAVYFGATRQQAAAAGFDDQLIYDQVVMDPPARIIPMLHKPTQEAAEIFSRWLLLPGKQCY
jgi:tRNA(Arg) A34 adenosine deaminase TadA